MDPIKITATMFPWIGTIQVPWAALLIWASLFAMIFFSLGAAFAAWRFKRYFMDVNRGFKRVDAFMALLRGGMENHGELVILRMPPGAKFGGIHYGPMESDEDSFEPPTTH